LDCRLPLFLAKTGFFLQRLAKVPKRSKITEILGKYGSFGGFQVVPENPGVAGSIPALSTCYTLRVSFVRIGITPLNHHSGVFVDNHI
jgi:hypothetical protein